MPTRSNSGSVGPLDGLRGGHRLVAHTGELGRDGIEQIVRDVGLGEFGVVLGTVEVAVPDELAVQDRPRNQS